MKKLNFEGSAVPMHTRDSLERYIVNGITPGSFLTALLSNDLFDACARADNENQRAIFDIVKWLYNNAPSGCYGGSQQVREWKGTEFYEAQAAAREYFDKLDRGLIS